MVGVDPALVARSKAVIKEALHRNLQGPLDHLQSYSEPIMLYCVHTLESFPPSEKYDCLVCGEAWEDVQKFLTEEHPLADFKQKIQHYRDLAREIASLDDVIGMEMFQLECMDIKHGLNEQVQDFILTLVNHLAHQHVEENKKICAEYERFQARALKDPEDSREMMDLIAYMETVKGGLVKEQWEAVQSSLSRLTYLLDIHTFTNKDLELNQVTITWPKKLDPIFEENEQIIEASKVRCCSHVCICRQ